MDVVWPVRDNPDEEQLRWSVRTVTANFPHDRVIFVGALPTWADPDTVVHIPTVQDSTKFHNIGINLEAVLASDVSDRFLWLNDDFFIMHPIADVPLLARLQSCDIFCDRLRPHPPTATYSAHNAFIEGVRSQRDILHAWGFDTSTLANVDAHFPIPIDKARLTGILERVKDTNPKHPIGHFRMIYGGGLEATRMQDAKVAGMNAQIPRTQVYVSTYKQTWNGAPGRHIRAHYPIPSRYERQPVGAASTMRRTNVARRR